MINPSILSLTIHLLITFAGKNEEFKPTSDHFPWTRQNSNTFAINCKHFTTINFRRFEPSKTKQKNISLYF